MKKFGFLFLLFLLALLAVACNTEQSPPAAEPPPADTVCTITLQTEVGTLDTPSLVAVSGTKLLLPTPQNVSFAWEFLGWVARANDTPIQTLTVTDSITLTAVFRARVGGAFTFLLTDNAVTLCTYADDADAIIVPETIDGHPVRTLADNLFAAKKAQTITLPAGVTTLGQNVFADCKNLTSVTLGDAITTLPVGAFAGCSALESVRLPANLTTIGARAFANCTSLVTLSATDKLTHVGIYAFASCENLTTLMLGNSLSTLPANMAIGCKKLTNFQAPTQATTIGDYAFADTGLETIAFSAVQHIGKYAFARTPLQTVTLSDSLQTIDNGAFAFCTTLAVFDGSQTVLQTIGADVFTGCAALQTVRLPNSVNTIGAKLFANCTALKTLVTPFVGDTLLGANTFGYFFGGDAVVGAYAIDGPHGTFYLPKTLTDVTITGSRLPNDAFRDCITLQTVTLSGNLQTLPERAFSGCSALQTVHLPETLGILEADAFKDCNRMESIRLPAQLRICADSAFDGMSRLTTIYADCYFFAERIATHPVQARIAVLYLAEPIAAVLEAGVPQGYTKDATQDTLLYVKFIKA